MSKTIKPNFIDTIFKSRLILLKILQKQGYNTDNYSNFSIGEISKMFTNKQLDIFLKKENGKQIYIKYHLTNSLRPAHIHEITDDLFNLENILQKTDDLIIITKQNPNDTLTKLIESLYKTDDTYFIILNIYNLTFNLLEHQLVPPHRILNKEEIDKLYTQYNITDNKQLPEISRHDAVIQLIGARPGNVIEIIRPSQMSITSKYYRLCY